MTFIFALLICTTTLVWGMRCIRRARARRS
jgi:hypothetical protein